MCDWRKQLAALVAIQDSELFPLSVFSIRPPDQSPWPLGLPVCDAIRDFYELCDGGMISLEATWSSKGTLAEQNRTWQRRLFDYRGDGADVLLPQLHLVLGVDSAGAPLIWNAESGELSTFYAQGGDWEHWNVSVDAYLQRIFCGQRHGEGLWSDALALLGDHH